jgi:hypothetical protein
VCPRRSGRTAPGLRAVSKCRRRRYPVIGGGSWGVGGPRLPRLDSQRREQEASLVGSCGFADPDASGRYRDSSPRTSDPAGTAAEARGAAGARRVRAAGQPRHPRHDRGMTLCGGTSHARRPRSRRSRPLSCGQPHPHSHFRGDGASASAAAGYLVESHRTDGTDQVSSSTHLPLKCEFPITEFSFNCPIRTRTEEIIVNCFLETPWVRTIPVRMAC